MRIPVVGQIDSRDGVSDKDARLTNTLMEIDEGITLACVRPALSSIVNATGNGNGLVCFNNNLINIYGSNIYTSPPNSATSVLSTVTGLSSTGNVVSNGLGIVIVGSSLSPTSTLKVSINNGNTWTDAVMPATDYWINIAYGGGLFVCVAYNSNRAAYSSDGITWLPATMPTNSRWIKTIWNGSKFCCVSIISGQSAISSDGQSWIGGALPAAFDAYDIAWNGINFCAVGGTKSSTSIDGISWSATHNIGSGNFQCVGWNGSSFITIAFNGINTFTSLDGATWIAGQAMPSSDSWSSVAINNNSVALVTGTFDTYATTSTNLGSWATDYLLPLLLHWTSVYWDGYAFCFCGYVGGNSYFYRASSSPIPAATIQNSIYDFAQSPL